MFCCALLLLPNCFYPAKNASPAKPHALHHQGEDGPLHTERDRDHHREERVYIQIVLGQRGCISHPKGVPSRERPPPRHIVQPRQVGGALCVKNIEDILLKSHLGDWQRSLLCRELEVDNPFRRGMFLHYHGARTLIAKSATRLSSLKALLSPQFLLL